MKVKRAFNGYLGFEPVSTVVDLMSGLRYEVTLDANYKMIKGEGTKDVMFQGAIIPNLTFLKWICCRLMSENHYLSVILNTNEFEKIEPDSLIVHRIILIVDQNIPIIQLQTLSQKLTDSDIILVTTDDVKVLNMIKSRIDKVECKAHIYINMSQLDSMRLLSAGFTTIYPYFGDI